MPERPDATFLLGVRGVTELVLVRHAKQALSDDFLRQPVGELRDPPLSELGVRQAKAVAAALGPEPIAAVYASSSGRARETAAVIAADLNLEAAVVDGIEEFGFFRELPPDMPARDAVGDLRFEGFQRRWARSRSWDAWPGSEPASDFKGRVIDAVEGLVARHQAERVVVVAHGGVINAYVGDFLGTTDDMFFVPAHASITRVRARYDRRVLSTLNEVQHLAGPGDLLTF
jgi:2,3-bisphosphoglycerate-dependent phosphoglycerate mutase